MKISVKIIERVKIESVKLKYSTIDKQSFVLRALERTAFWLVCHFKFQHTMPKEQGNKMSITLNTHKQFKIR